MKLEILCNKLQAQKIADLFSETGAFGSGAVGWHEVSDQQWCVEIYFEEAPDLPEIRDFISGQLQIEPASYSASIQALDNIDWVSKVQRELSPVHAGRFVVFGSHDRARFVRKRQAIEIDAGQAFGTAHHGTTRGCLLAIDTLIKKREFRSVLDVGTGSGVLAIAIAKAVISAQILAFDIDPIAVSVGRENCRNNQVGNRVNAFFSGDLDHPKVRKASPFDLVCANILAGPLKMLAHDISSLTARNGYAVLSGLLDSQADAVLSHYRTQKFALERRLSLEGWSTLILRRRP